ncbi:MAG TPA: hypothetical protein VG894_09985, partial [Bauldia sp.]|nr:hypothetical protein [Bauldia sp.]
ELAFGPVSVTPQVGFRASNASSHSEDFADVGAIGLTSDGTLDVYAGATVAARVMLGDGTTFTPFVSLLANGQPLAPDSALFSDLAGGSAQVPLDETGGYAALGLGADLFRAPGPSGKATAMGLRADFKRGADFSENSYAAYAQVKF